MTRQDLIDLHKDTCDRARSLMEAKNEDYAGLKQEHTVFGNLGLCESMGVCTTEMGIVVRMTDKISRLANVLQKPAAVSESVEDTIQDVINYAILLKAKYVDRRNNAPQIVTKFVRPSDDQFPDVAPPATLRGSGQSLVR